MAKDKGAVIIKKVSGGGHAAAHGGAWKVAFADFMTALMAFFLVMWLMGSDEASKSAIEQYFNNPTSAWRTDLNDKETVPLGDMTGSGESILKGAGGSVPEEMIAKPSRVMNPIENGGQDKNPADILSQLPIKPQGIQLSFNEDQIFKKGSSTEMLPTAEKFLKQVGQMTKGFDGKIQIQGTYNAYAESGKEIPGSYEFQLARAVAMERYLVDNNLAPEEKIVAKVTGQGRSPAGITDATAAAQKTEQKLEISIIRE